MSLLLPAGATGKVEVDIEDLNEDERFFITVYSGSAPGASFTAIEDKRRALSGMNHEDVSLRCNRGLEGLMGRGLFGFVRGEDGKPVLDKDGDPQVRLTGRLITRMKLAKNPTRH